MICKLKTTIDNETRSWFFEKINKIDKPLQTYQVKRESTQTKSQMKKGEITNTIEI